MNRFYYSRDLKSGNLMKSLKVKFHMKQKYFLIYDEPVKYLSISGIT